MNSHRRLPRALSTAVPATAVAILVVACGGSKKPPASTVSGHSAKDNGAQDAYRFSACMRTHGVTNFEDPRVRQSGNHIQVAVHVDPAITSSPNFKSAQKTCAHLLPGMLSGPSPAEQRSRARAILAFAVCMRRHGFPKFPDPTSQGQLTPTMLAQAGIDLQQPAIRPAAYACLPVAHGMITRADVNQAIANPGGGSSTSG